MTVKASTFKPARDKVFVTELEAGVRKTQNGIIIPDDNMKESGIRTRWGRVWLVGADVEDVKAGDWVLLEHGRWSHGMDMLDDEGETFKVWHIDFPNGVLLVSDTDPRPHEIITL